MDILDRTPPRADQRIPYGQDPSQFGDLWMPRALPAGKRIPVVVFLHGGWWQSRYDLAYAGFLADALRQTGIAVWSLEYRRVGNPGGGFPGTFQDAATGFEFVRQLARTYPLDLDRVVVAGHSAGGHLAFWIAGRHHVPEDSPIAQPRPGLGVHAAISLAGAVDLRLVCELSTGPFAHGRNWVMSLMDGTPAEFPTRFAAANPGDLLPLGVPQWLLQGDQDGQIPPELPNLWRVHAARAHDSAVTLRILPNAGHFDLVDPTAAAWPTVAATFHQACSR